MKSIIYILLFLNFAGSQTITSQEKIQYNLKKGDVFKIEQVAIQNIVQKMDSTEHFMTNSLSGIFVMEVVNVADHKFVLDINFETFKLKTESNIYGVFSEVDTSIPPTDEEDIEAKIFQGLIGPKFQMVLLKTGKIESLTGIENLVYSMIDQVEIEDDFSKAMIRKTVEKEFNNQDMLESLQQFTYIYPETKVEVNQTWNNSYSGAVTANNTWKLISYSKGEINLEANATVQLKTNEDSVIMELAGTQQTEVTTNTASGFIKSMVVTQQTEGITIVKDMNNLEVPTTLTSTITYKSL